MNTALPILLIEDNPMDVDLTRRAFIRHNLTNPLEVLRDGQEAIDFIARWREGEPAPSVILLDLKLPKVSGLDVLKSVREHSSLGTVPVVVLCLVDLTVVCAVGESVVFVHLLALGVPGVGVGEHGRLDDGRPAHRRGR